MCISVDLDKAVNYVVSINVYNDGKINAYSVGDSCYNDIILNWINMVGGAHQMPAFGVSLNRETQKALKSGLWVEFVFDCVYESCGMPYERLLVNVGSSWQGFNIIRYNKANGYDGRCFYYDLVGKDMSNFYQLLLNLS